MKQARKVALINVADFPKEAYSAYWEIHVDDSDPENDGYRWRARMMARQPVGWFWKGKTTTDRPDVPEAVHPKDVPVSQVMYLKLPAADQAKVRSAQQARRDAIGKIDDALPRPVFLLSDTAGMESTRDEADTAAQQWVLDHIEAYKIPAPAANPQAGYALALGPGGMLVDILFELFRRLFGPMLASLIAYATALRTSRMTQVENALDAGSGPALIRIYNSTRPATGGTATTLGAELTCSDPAGTVSSAVLTFSAITADSSADNSITATWGRAVDSTATFVFDFNVGTSGSDLNLNTTTITSGVNVAISSFTLTDGSS